MTQIEKLKYIAHVEILAHVAKTISRSMEGTHAASELLKLTALLKEALAENDELKRQSAVEK